ncbi:MAG: serine protease [Chloroflexi bacterium]|nr:serine protease [Chloroflexota bacterium]MDA1172980.1 serine protease [Chloroflexota bacterium]
MIDPSGRIVTTSTNLGTAPLVSFRTFDGATGQAWVVGRDDNLDLAVLEVLNPGQQFASVEVSSEDPPNRNENLVLMHFKAGGVVTQQFNSAVVGSRQDAITGISYLQLQGFSVGDEDGGAVFDALGRLRGLRMDSDRMISIGIGRIGEVWAMDSFALASSMIPRLQAGVSIIYATAGQCVDLGAPPPIPAIYKGDLSIGGAPAAIGLRMYARTTKTSTGEELWFSQPITNVGRYFLTISICDPIFANGVVDFWLNSKPSPTTSLYTPSSTLINNLFFP